MHKEILTKEQVDLLPLVKSFSKKFYLAGGTAIALQIGHRRSIDFDFFTSGSFKNDQLRRTIANGAKIQRVIRDEEGEYTIVVNKVQLTFFQYPFTIQADNFFDRSIRFPDLLTLAAMKAYALGRRAKWKDYVDLYFVIKKYHGLKAIVERARAIFGDEFNEKLFREQLSYFQDINYAEKVIYLPGFRIADAVVKRALIKFSTSR